MRRQPPQGEGDRCRKAEQPARGGAHRGGADGNALVRPYEVRTQSREVAVLQGHVLVLPPPSPVAVPHHTAIRATGRRRHAVLREVERRAGAESGAEQQDLRPQFVKAGQRGVLAEVAVRAVVPHHVAGQRAQGGEGGLRMGAADRAGERRTASESRPIDGAAVIAGSNAGIAARTASRSRSPRPWTRARYCGEVSEFSGVKEGTTSVPSGPSACRSAAPTASAPPSTAPTALSDACTISTPPRSTPSAASSRDRRARLWGTADTLGA